MSYFGTGPGHRSIPVGTRVRVTTEPAPDCRTGVVTGNKWTEKNGCLVKHDDGPSYGWSWTELEEEVLNAVPIQAYEDVNV